MPILGYKCKKCGATFDMYRSISEASDDSSVKCPRCGTKDPERVTAIGVEGSSSSSCGSGMST